MKILGEWTPYGGIDPEQLDRLANQLLAATAVLMAGPLAGSLARMDQTGWLFIFNIQILLYSLVLLAFLFRKHVDPRLKAGFLVFAYYMVPVAGIYSLGQLKGGIMYLPIAIVIAVFFFGPRFVFFIALISLTGFVFVANGYLSGELNSAISLEVANTNLPQWVNFGFSFVAFFTIFSIVMFGYRSILASKVSEISMQRDRILNLINYDQLTGVGTQLLATERLSNALEEAQSKGGRGALMLIRLENLDELIDNYGIEEGDRILKEASTRIDSLLRPEDLLARAGGSRFLIVLPVMKTTDRAEFLAQMIHENLSKPIPAVSREVRLHCKIGVTIFPSEHLNAEQLLQKANTARFNAEKSGVDTVILE
jgi:diguanylate cyclase (GGDEF)-like protein